MSEFNLIDTLLKQHRKGLEYYQNKNKLSKIEFKDYRIMMSNIRKLINIQRKIKGRIDIVL